MLDMFELRVVSVKGNPIDCLKNFDTAQAPILIALGSIFETNSDLNRVRNFFTDLFSNQRLDKITVDFEKALNLVINLTGNEDGSFALDFCKVDRQNSRLVEIGISVEFKMNRSKMAAEELFREACKQPKFEKKTKLKKVLERNGIGETLARVHVKQQDLRTLRLKKLKKRATKTSKTGNVEEGANEQENGNEHASE